MLLLLIACSEQNELSKAPPAKLSLKEQGYIGDQDCALCHAEIYRSFKGNGMGRSFYRPSAHNIIEDYQKAPQIYDKHSNLAYRPVRQDAAFFQEEMRLDDNNSPIHELMYKVDYIIGSGNHTRSYLREENGFIYELPITWYSQEKKWDLSPSYEVFNQRFSRPIVQECMNCHNSYSSYIDQSVNQYHLPLPEGIGCERCHGPGADHVKKRLYQETQVSTISQPDTTIVNPRHLSKDLQVDICFQCHLQGLMTVLKSEKDQTDFRPGMNLNEIRSIFLDADQSPDNPGIASQGARMLMSPCFKESGGQLLCTTCHDPHSSIAETPRTFYSDVCLSCHAMESLSASTEEITHEPGADCISCHMLKSETSDIPHVTGTDHWIRKRPGRFQKQDLEQYQIVQKMTTLKPVFAVSGPLADLRLGIAYVKYYEAKHSNDLYLKRAIPLIKIGLSANKDHENGLFYLGKAYAHLKDLTAAERHFKKLVQKNPKHALAHFELAQIQSSKGKFRAAEISLLKSLNIFKDNAKAYNNLGNLYSDWNRLDSAENAYKKAIEIQPGYSQPYHNLGDLLLAQRQDTESASSHISEALRLEPDFVRARHNLGVVKLLSDDTQGAIEAFELCLRSNPGYVPAHSNLAKIFLHLDNNQQALFHVQKILEFQPENREALSLLKMLTG